MDEAISKAVLGETLTTQMGETGSYAASQTHNGVRMELVRADADLLSATLNETLMTWLTEFHFPGANPPRIWRRVEEPVDAKAEAEKDQILSGIGFEADEEYIQEKYGAGWKKKQWQGESSDQWPVVSDQLADAPHSAAQQPTGEPGTGDDPSALAIPLPTDVAHAGPGLNVQDTALSGAQVAALVQIIEQVKTGGIPKASAGPLIRASFPAISPELVNEMLGPIEVKESQAVVPVVKEAEANTQPVAFSEVDGLTDYAEAATIDPITRMLEPVRRLVNCAESLDDIRDGLLELYPEMASVGLGEALSNAMTVAFRRGMGSVKR
jgi:phage gp29-like protein